MIKVLEEGFGEPRVSRGYKKALPDSSGLLLVPRLRLGTKKRYRIYLEIRVKSQDIPTNN